jgi:hypothetical protein
MNKPALSTLVVSLAAAMPAVADDVKGSSVTPRQVAHCMLTRVRANQSESYRDAYKACKRELETAKRDPASPDSATAMNAASAAEAPKDEVPKR